MHLTVPCSDSQYQRGSAAWISRLTATVSRHKITGRSRCVYRAKRGAKLPAKHLNTTAKSTAAESVRPLIERGCCHVLKQAPYNCQLVRSLVFPPSNPV
jgi:hypothetical protein